MSWRENELEEKMFKSALENTRDIQTNYQARPSFDRDKLAKPKVGRPFVRTGSN